MRIEEMECMHLQNFHDEEADELVCTNCGIIMKEKLEMIENIASLLAIDS